MGAGNSTAISNSSLDLSHRQRYRIRNQFQENHLASNNSRNIKTNNQNFGQKSFHTNMKQSNSYYDLNSNHLIHNDNLKHHLDYQKSSSNNNKKGWFDTNHSEAYSLSNANIGVSRPIMILPNESISPSLSSSHKINNNINGNTKKILANCGNAGVANRIQRCQKQQQQQQQLLRSGELRKFSDSLPSLNNLNPHQLAAYNLKSVPNNNYGDDDDVESNLQFSGHHQRRISPINNQNCAKQKLYRIDKINSNLVTHYNSQHNHSYHNHHHQMNLKPNRNSNQVFVNSIGNSSHDGKQQHNVMKRAISLSSLHNNGQQQYYRQNQHQHFTSQSPNQAKYSHPPQYPPPHGNCKQQLAGKILNGKQKKYNSGSAAMTTPESIDHFASTCDLKRPAGYLKQQHNQQASFLSKKLFKYKQAPNVGAGQVPKRYSKHIDQQQQQQQQQQQGCPVLPPLPRSQSLHELIQLRATENGQRMRTTGTLRGPFGSSSNTGEATNKVNLVAELLENRRQQKLNENQEEINLTRDSETMLSQSSSSSDDGIHDVSMTEDHQSTGDSRRTNANKRVISNNNDHRADLEFNSSVENKDRIFKKNLPHLQHSNKLAINNNQQHINKRFSQQNFSDYNRQEGEEEEEHENQNSAFLSASQNSDQQQITNKSTLKRSLSHSALQTSLSNLRDDNLVDEDESDDLNELAKFLHQFKQRQMNKNSTNNGGSSEENSPKINNHKPVSTSTTTTSTSSTNLVVGANNLQQSPNSTTSSSGFASSTCTTNSMSSSESSSATRECNQQQHQLRRQQQQQQRKSTNNNSEQELIDPKKIYSGRKKYPAPPRPTDGSSNNPLIKSKQQQQQQQQQSSDQGKISKCLISSKLKLSSSLLSIVDEYNSTLQKGDQLLSKNLMDDNKLKVTRQKYGQNSIKSDQSSSVELDNDNDSSMMNNYVDDDYQRQHLEQLKRYTQLRQMSQSELALNHLTSTSLASNNLTKKHSSKQVKGKRDNSEREDNHSSNIKPYKSRLINLIRRISDRSEVNNGQQGLRDSPVGSHYEYGKNSFKQETINQNSAEPILSLSNKQLELQQQKQHLHSQAQKHKSGSKQHLKGKNIKEGTSLSESLCDLNFDCDFELIKNCGSSANEHRGAARHQQQHQEQQQQQTGGSSLLLSQSADLKSFPDGSSDVSQRHDHHREGTEMHQAAIYSSKGENNNWQLAPTSLSLSGSEHREHQLDLKTRKQQQQQSKRQQQQQQSYQSREVAKASGRSVCNNNGYKLHASSSSSTTTTTTTTTKTAPAEATASVLESQTSQASPASTTTRGDKLPSHAKLKWSASGWLMNSNKGGSQSSGSSNSKNEQKQVEMKRSKHENEEASSGKSKSCLTKFILSSRTSKATISTNCATSDANTHQGSKFSEKDRSDNAASLIESTAANYAKVNNEANQLLDDLDHSLDLVSSNSCSNSKVPTKSWWKMDGDEMLPMSRQIKDYQHAGYLVPDDDDDYDDTMEKKRGNKRVTRENRLTKQSNGDYGVFDNSNNDHDGNNNDHDDDDDDEDDDVDYASISRAMLKATFDVKMDSFENGGKLELKSMAKTSGNLNLNPNSDISPERPGSPSNSFTFSAPSSPVPAQVSISNADGNHLKQVNNNNKQANISSSSNNNNKSHQQLERSKLNGAVKNLNHQCRLTTSSNGGTTNNEHLIVHRDGMVVKQSGEAYTRKYIPTGGNHVISSSSTATTPNCEFKSQLVATSCGCSGGNGSKVKLSESNSVGVSSCSSGSGSGSDGSVSCSLNGYKGEEATTSPSTATSSSFSSSSSNSFSEATPITTKAAGSKPSGACYNLDNKRACIREAKEKHDKDKDGDNVEEEGDEIDKRRPTENVGVKRMILVKRFGLEPNCSVSDTNEYSPICCPEQGNKTKLSSNNINQQQQQQHACCVVSKTKNLSITSKANNDNLDTCFASASPSMLSSQMDKCCKFMNSSNEKEEPKAKRTDTTTTNGLVNDRHPIACRHQDSETNGLLSKCCQSDGCEGLNCSEIQVKSGQKSHCCMNNISAIGERKLQQACVATPSELAANGCSKLQVAPNSSVSFCQKQQQHHSTHLGVNCDCGYSESNSEFKHKQEKLKSDKEKKTCVCLAAIQGHSNMNHSESSTCFSSNLSHNEKTNFINTIDEGSCSKLASSNNSTKLRTSENVLNSPKVLHDNRSTTYCKRSAPLTTKVSPIGVDNDKSKLITQRDSCHCLSDKQQNHHHHPIEVGKISKSNAETQSSFLLNHSSSTSVVAAAECEINPSRIQNNGSKASKNFGLPENKSSCVHEMRKLDQMSSCELRSKIVLESKREIHHHHHHHHNNNQSHPVSNAQQVSQSQKQDNICYGNSNLSNCCAKSHGDDETLGLTDVNTAATTTTVAAVTKCKVALCHHPSSNHLSQENYTDKDVKLEVSGCNENLILKPGHHLVVAGSKLNNDGVDSDKCTDVECVSSNLAALKNKRCQCCLQSSRQQQQQQQPTIYSPEEQAGSNNNSKCLVKSSQLNKFNKNHKRTNLSPSTNLICRSNSELVSPNLSFSNYNNSVGSKGKQANSGGVTSKDKPLFGKLRNSLLNRKDAAINSSKPLAKLSKHLANSQLSLMNHGHYVSPFIDPRSDFVSTQLNSQPNVEFDDNFILKRKTPNAGLKTRC